jgi:hypothetical protein
MAKHELSKDRLVHMVTALTGAATQSLPIPHWDALLQRWVQCVPVPAAGIPGPASGSETAAQRVVDRALAQQRLADALADGRAASAAEFIGANVGQFVDELSSDQAALADIVLACAVFQTAADLLDSGQPPRRLFSDTADRLFEAAAHRLDAKHRAAFPADAKHETSSPCDAKHEAVSMGDAKHE